MSELEIDNNGYKNKAKLVKDGYSRTFEVWQLVLPTLSKDEFIENLKWVCEDDQKDKASRGMALTPDGIAKLYYEYTDNGCKAHFTATKEEWTGARFRIPCFDDRYADFDGTILQRFKLDLSSKDNV